MTDEEIPITLGHEFSGVITEIGSDVSDFQVGQHCVVRPTISCGQCEACEAGFENICQRGGFIGLSGGGGGLSESVCVPTTHVNLLPDNISLEIGSLIEPLAVAWHAVSTVMPLGAKTAALVIGGGPIGLAVVLCLKAMAVETIVLSEVASSRQAFGTKFGATHVVDPLSQDITGFLSGQVDRTSVDVVFDCAGVPSR